MAELDYEKLQARAADSMRQAWSAASADNPAAEARMIAQAQLLAMLTVGAALREVAEAIREHG